jgi:hypothetical protein
MPLGDLDASTSVLAFGDGEPGSPFDQSELTLWTSQSFKPSPVSRAAITAQLGPTVESTLSY